MLHRMTNSSLKFQARVYVHKGHPSFFRGVLSFGVCYSEIPPKVMRGKPIWEVVEQMLLQGTQQ